jgi:NADH dehydrogenase FAD-containing subunit
LVIVGASFAGLLLVDKLHHAFDITLVERKDHFEFICAMPNYLTDPEQFRDENAYQYSRMLENP